MWALLRRVETEMIMMEMVSLIILLILVVLVLPIQMKQILLLQGIFLLS
jgi:hypothetical protein